ncbi:DUF3108 domain-containing protein [candidate division KSB1 bacterium]|nr:DUF3108 domain-containing protein [candidate division KSB1 bacterium]
MARGQLVLSFVLGCATTLSAADLSLFRGEQLEFDMFYKGIKAATSRMQLQVDDAQTKITWHVESRPFITLLFKIDNRYEAILSDDGMLLQVNKVIDQKNIQQQLTIDYDQKSLRATANVCSTWPITDDCNHVLSMFYDLRGRSLSAGDSIHYILDVEGQLWRLSGTVEAHRDRAGTLDILFHFSPVMDIRDRLWKTDLLTNRLAHGQSTLFMQLGPQQQPLLIRFGDEKTPVEMRLIKR